MKKKENTLLKNYVTFLIRSKQEGQYWDFKREWYADNGDLVHDIICMANNLTHNDGLIIIGVDEENAYSPTDVSDDSNRKNTQNIVDLLKDIHFAGDIRPFVYVETIQYGDREIDVIVVKNDTNTPYYLIEKYRKVCPYNIYTRVGDTNTPINRSADFNNVERLWKKRFGIDAPPIERIKNYLQHPEEWDDAGNDGNIQYNKQFPEFTYEQEYLSEKKDVKFFFYGQPDCNPNWYSAKIKYHQTVLSELLLIGLDGCRLIVPVPKLYGFALSRTKTQWNITFDYYIENSLEYILGNMFLFNINENNLEKALIRNKYLKIILVFKSEGDIEPFIDFAIIKWPDVDVKQYQEQLPRFPEIEGYNMQVLKAQYQNGLILKDLLDEYYDDCRDI